MWLSERVGHERLNNFDDGRDLRSNVNVFDDLNRPGREGPHTSSAGEVCRLHRLNRDATHLARVVGKHDSVAHRERYTFARLIQGIAGRPFSRSILEMEE